MNQNRRSPRLGSPPHGEATLRLYHRRARPPASDVNELYGVVGWNEEGERTLEKTTAALGRSLAVVTARISGELVGFGRLIGDSYTAQVIDVMTHPSFRRQGIARAVLTTLLEFARGRYLGVYLIDGSGIPGLYERHGFEPANPASDRLMYWTRP